MKEKDKKTVVKSLLLTMVVSVGLVGCGTGGKSGDSGFDVKKTISVVSREEGSGTRGAFVELTGVENKDGLGNKKDMTMSESVIANKTDVVMNNIVGETYSIGYISLGSLNDTVKALAVDGVVPSADTVKNGTYPISRPFNIATNGKPSELAEDFVNFIMSKEGQAVVGKTYVSVKDGANSYVSKKITGKLVVAGSSSVSPLMEKLIEAYKSVNPAASIELQTSDSTAGMRGLMEGTCDIGMASRALKDSELKKLTPQVIAMDGIVVIVNKENPRTDISSKAIKSVYTGETTTWEAISNIK